MRRFLVYGFASVHDALAAEVALQSAGVSVVAIPSPGQLGDLCGVALRVDPADEVAAVTALAASGIAPRATAEIDDI